MIIDIQRYWGERQMYFVGELASKIIRSMQQDGKVTLFSKEARNATISGLYDLLDQMCYTENWAKENITIITSNYYDVLYPREGYIIKHAFYDYPKYSAPSNDSRVLDKIKHTAWNKEKKYGMFLGRANTTRLCGVYQHLNFKYKHFGLTSFHHDLSYHIEDYYLREFLTETNLPYSSISQIKPYSDIDIIRKPPITLHHFDYKIWNSVYEKIPLEIVFETNEDDNIYMWSEKLIRPMIYKRPFILVASQHIIKQFFNKLEEIWEKDPNLPGKCPGTIKFFNHIIPDYDMDRGIQRVEYAFDIVKQLIESKRIDTIIEDCHDDIENNFCVAKNLLKIIEKGTKSPYIEKESALKPWYATE